MRRMLILAVVVCISVPAFAGDLKTAAALRDQALGDSTAWNVLESLTTEIGPRPAGSPAALRARDWALAKLRALGFANVHAEPFAKPSWARGEESAEVLAPFPHKAENITVLALTPEGKIREIRYWNPATETTAKVFE